MHILTTSAGLQELNVVLRSSVAFARISLYDKSERKELVANPDVTDISESNGITTIELSFEQNLVEGRFYSLTIENFAQSDVYYKGLVFCTNESDYNKFDVHKDDYVVEDSYDNEYVIL